MDYCIRKGWGTNKSGCRIVTWTFDACIVGLAFQKPDYESHAILQPLGKNPWQETEMVVCRENGTKRRQW